MSALSQEPHSTEQLRVVTASERISRNEMKCGEESKQIKDRGPCHTHTVCVCENECRRLQVCVYVCDNGEKVFGSLGTCNHNAISGPDRV